MQNENRQEHNSRQEEEKESAPGKEQTNHPARTSVWEWVIAAVGLLLVLGSIGFMLYQSIWGSEAPPDVTVRVDAIKPTSNGYLVEFTARNKGGVTLAGVKITAELKRGEEKIESSETTLDYIPENSERKGGLFFSKNPHTYTLELRAAGYQEP